MNMAVSPVSDKADQGEFLRDVIAGLRQPQKTLPCKYLYDEAGSRIFEKICELEDYYLTRTEAQIFSDNLEEIAASIGPGAVVIEPGAGNCEKVEPLLEALERPQAYIPIDISPEILLAARGRIQARLPQLEVEAHVADFSQPGAWRGAGCKYTGRRVIFFPGSTIGNFDPGQAQQLLEDFASQLGQGDGLLIGTDLVKDAVVLERAYNDSEHITAEFNKNLLVRINNELEGNFDPQMFAHRAFYHPLRQRVEMHLVSLKAQRVRISGEEFGFSEGETIHTENSHKYSLQGFASMLDSAGFKSRCNWVDGKELYALHYAEIPR
ncbi:L-histidine N(alpha)-methyltransferase [Microbulbifer yueqingensis]|uniref:Dimethylhistidine N-methyltransferase n=1 Tax=Microbulbifer yueqingensis TaxID=658219 RepID=A0A1G8ZRE6_9GAMM|nr:L-histidine N(alpha)-methyltransferase [Microbulbifer yueqingensis]SDK17627.1 dimethylhistidine N-methyltransferase [Microbulbifer yueqingensis]